MRRSDRLDAQRIAVLFALASGVTSSVARADEEPPPKTITAPTGWTIDEEQSKTLGAKLRGRRSRVSC